MCLWHRAKYKQHIGNWDKDKSFSRGLTSGYFYETSPFPCENAIKNQMILGQHFPEGDPYFAKFVIALHQVICMFISFNLIKKRQGLSEIAISKHTTITCSVTHMTTLYYCSVNHQSEKHIFKIIIYFFDMYVHQNVSQIM